MMVHRHFQKGDKTPPSENEKKVNSEEPKIKPIKKPDKK